jgi:hypothetical protein
MAADDTVALWMTNVFNPSLFLRSWLLSARNDR